jgi:hypothetical protein
MAPDDDIPEHDQLADATRRALGQIADTTATDSLSWGAVRSRARRVKTMRITTAIAACVIVLAGVGAVIGTANRNQDHVNVAGPSANPTTTSAPELSTSSSAPPLTTTLPSTPGTCGPGQGTCGILGVSPTTVASPPPASAAPGASDFEGSMALNDKKVATLSMYVGDDVDIAATIQNITDHAIWPSDSRVPASVATVCTSEPSGRQFLWWMTNVPMAPGERSGRSGTFTPTGLDVGTVTCQVDIVSTDMVGTKFDTDAGGDDAITTIIAPVAAVAPVLITVLPSPGSTTSVPLPTGTTAPATTTTTTP